MIENIDESKPKIAWCVTLSDAYKKELFFHTLMYNAGEKLEIIIELLSSFGNITVLMQYDNLVIDDDITESRYVAFIHNGTIPVLFAELTRRYLTFANEISWIATFVDCSFSRVLIAMLNDKYAEHTTSTYNPDDKNILKPLVNTRLDGITINLSQSHIDYKIIDDIFSDTINKKEMLVFKDSINSFMNVENQSFVSTFHKIVDFLTIHKFTSIITRPTTINTNDDIIIYIETAHIFTPDLFADTIGSIIKITRISQESSFKSKQESMIYLCMRNEIQNHFDFYIIDYFIAMLRYITIECKNMHVKEL